MFQTVETIKLTARETVRVRIVLNKQDTVKIKKKNDVEFCSKAHRNLERRITARMKDKLDCNVNCQRSEGLQCTDDHSGRDQHDPYRQQCEVQDSTSSYQFLKERESSNLRICAVGEDELYGWGRFRPSWLQWMCTPKWFLFCICLVGAVQGMIVNGFVNVVITTVEKRFSLASAEAGLIASCYDLAAVVLALPVSYLGAHAHKPKWLGIGTLVMGLGSIVFSLPHFTTGSYSFKLANESSSLCNESVNVTVSCSQVTDTSLNSYKYVFYLGQLLHGIGASPLYTIGVAFIDDNVRPKLVSVYVGKLTC